MKQDKNQVYSVTTLDLTTNGKGKLNVSVTGSVNTSGWTDIELIRRVNIAEDGTEEFDLVGNSPSENVVVTMGFKNVSASTSVAISPELTQVIVYAKTNSMSASLNDEASSSDDGTKTSTSGEQTIDGGWRGFQGRIRSR